MREALERLLTEIAALNGCNWVLEFDDGSFFQSPRMKISFVFPDDEARSWTHWMFATSLPEFKAQFHENFVPACRNAGMMIPGEHQQPLNCKVCGGERVSILGQHPKDAKRIVCPTCMADTLADIRRRVSPEYNQTKQA